jgi:hypothetical protein
MVAWTGQEEMPEVVVVVVGAPFREYRIYVSPRDYHCSVACAGGVGFLLAAARR